MKVLTAFVTDATVAYWLKDDGPAEPLATIVNHGMDAEQVSIVGLALLNALSLNGPKPAPVKREPREPRQAPAKRRRVQSYNVSADAVLADIRAHPGTICSETAGRLLGPSKDGDGHMQVVNRRATELAAAGKIRFDQRVRPDRKGRPARSYFPVAEPVDPVSSSSWQ